MFPPMRGFATPSLYSMSLDLDSHLTCFITVDLAYPVASCSSLILAFFFSIIAFSIVILDSDSLVEDSDSAQVGSMV